MSAGLSSDHHHKHHHHLMDKENLFNFPSDFPHDFASHYSIDSETDDEQITQLTHRFSRSASLQEPLFNLKGKRVFTCSPEYALGWFSSTPSPAAQVARMKLAMSTCNGNGGVIGVPQAFEHHYLSPWERSDGVELLRQQHFHQNRGVSVSARPSSQAQNQHRLYQRKTGVDGSRGGGYTAAKREYGGTGVFLPRGYGDDPPESRKRQASNLPGGMTQSFTKSFVPFPAPPELQAHINGGFVSHNELLMAQRKAMMLASRPLHQSPERLKSNIHGLVSEAAVNNPAVLLPQEWTY